jgi:hypothetical protein
MSSTPLQNSGGTTTAANRTPAAKVIAGALANSRVAQSLINALGACSINAIVATSTSQTTNFGSLQQGDFVVHLPFTAPSPLGAAAGFAILGASTVTNTGSSVITGNLGLYPGTSVTGFPPGTVTGTEYINDATAQAAQTSALSAFTTMQTEGLAGTTIAATLDGQTLTPGAYQFTGGAAHLAASGAGNLTFNGAGTYILYTASTLTTGAGGTPTMTLSGGATAANIFWIVGSSATINSGSPGTFQGNIIAQASITDTEGGTVNGSLIALTGAVTLSAAADVNTESSFGAGASFSTIAAAGNLGYAATVGDLYLDLTPINLDSNNPIIPPPPAGNTARYTGNGGTEF